MSFTCGVCANCRWLVAEMYCSILGRQTYLAEFSVAEESETFLSARGLLPPALLNFHTTLFLPLKLQENWQMAPETKVGL